MATNLFKQLLLKGLHIAKNPQVSAVFDALAVAGCEQQLSDKTWRSWFSQSAIVPKLDKAKVLDAFAVKAIRVPGPLGGPLVPLPGGTFSALIHGGIVQALTAPSKAKKLLPILLARVLEYEPLSPVHLHLDAIEIGALAEGVGDIPWMVVKALGAERILDILAARWRPRHGTVYSELSSDMALEWQDASEEERCSIRTSCARFKPDRFQYFMNTAPIPDWGKVGIEPDIAGTHIYKALFAIGADSSFLVADRLSTWSLDLATAALAMHALAWTNRYETFGTRVSEEMIYWGAFDSLLFKDKEPSFDQFDLLPAMEISSAEWNTDSDRTLLLGRQAYHETLAELGASPSEVLGIAMRGARAHPLIYSN